MLGSHMAEAVGSLVSSSHPNRTAAQLAQLLNSKDAVAQAGTAAIEATLQAAVAVAPASVKPLKFPGGLTATEAAASLDGATTDTAAGVLPQQQSRASHSAASRALTPKSNRSSRSGSLSPTLRPKQHAQPEQQQQQQLQAVQGPGDGFFLSTSCPAGSHRCSSAAAAPEGTSRHSTRTLGTYASLTVITAAERAASSQGSAGNRCAGQAVSGGSPGSCQVSAAGTSSPFALASVFRPSLSPAVDGLLQQPQPGSEQQQQQASPADSRGGTSSPGRSSRLQTGSSRCSSPVPALAPGTPQGHAAAGSPHVSLGSRDGSPGALRNSSSIPGSASQQPPVSARQAKHPGPPREAGGTSMSGGVLPTSSRLSSATGQNSPAGRVQDQQLQLVEEQEELATKGATGSNSSSSNGGAEQQHGGQLSSLYGLSLSAAICMADLVRQVRRPLF